MKGFKLFILCLLFISACKQNETPEDIIGKEKMIRIMADLHVIDGYMSSLVYSDTMRVSGKNYYATVYKNYNTSPVLYNKSLEYYSMDPVMLDSMYSSVEKILSEKEAKINKIQALKLERSQKLEKAKKLKDAKKLEKTQIQK